MSPPLFHSFSLHDLPAHGHWILWRGAHWGPYTPDQIRALYQQNLLSSHHLVFDENQWFALKDWLQLHDPSREPPPPSSETDLLLSDQSRILFALLALLFGPLGVHNFYLGLRRKALLQFLLTLLCLFLQLGLLIPYFWAFLDALLTTKDSEGNELF